MTTIWSVNGISLKGMPAELIGDRDEVCDVFAYFVGNATTLEFDAMTDQVDVYRTQGGRRRRYATLMAEGVMETIEAHGADGKLRTVTQRAPRYRD